MPSAICLLLFAGLAMQKGVNFTAEGRSGYGSEQAITVLRQLPRYGINSIALVPYGMIRRGETVIRFGGLERDDDVVKIAAEAHRLRLRVLLKPQIWTPGAFVGDLDFPTDPARAAWFGSYREFVRHYARLATRIKADIFCVGTELSKLSSHDTEWRQMIREVRTLYRGPLTYAAVQGPEFETLRFWDALDYIGLNNYYPLDDDLSAAAVVAKVEAVYRKYRKPVIFPEAGFPSLQGPHRAPWDETPRSLSLEDQARCYEAIFRAFWAKPWFKGIYWWKVGSNGFGGPDDGSHTPWRKPAMEVVRRWYAR